jgi:hypothetical protein
MEYKGQITSASAAMKYMLAGKSFVTLVSLASGNRYTYKIELTDKRNPNDADAYFVSLLNGPDNWSNYQYIGLIRNGSFGRTAKSRVSADAPSFIGFDYCFAQLSKGTINGFEVWHEGKCGRCGRKLTVPESIATGFGPECAGMVNAASVAVAAVGTVAPQRNLNFDGSVRQPKVKPVAVAGVAAPAAAPSNYSNVGELDAMIRARIATYRSEAPENYYQDGELDEKQAFNVAYNMFRVQIEKEGRS